MTQRESNQKTAPAQTKESLVNFDRPPVSEVVCGVGFPNLDKLSPAHIGLWWVENQSEFPGTETRPPVIGFAEKDLLPMLGRSVFTSKDESKLIQIQTTRFYFNWKKSKGHEIYPRYSAVYEDFTKHFANFEDFVGKNGLGQVSPFEYNLTYVNHIIKNEPWQKFSDIHRVFPSILWKKTADRKYLTEAPDLSLTYVFGLRDQPGKLQVTIQTGVRTADDTPLFRLELAASVTKSDGLEEHTPESMSRWFDGARKAIVLGFVDLTDEKTQIETWGRRD